MTTLVDLQKENEKLNNKIKELEEKLKSYTYNQCHKKYYDKNVEVIKDKTKNYIDKLKNENPEKLKQWRHTAYLNRKAKILQKQQDELNLQN